MSIEAGHIWILCGLALLGAELVLPGVFLLWIGLAAIGTGLALMAFAFSFGATVTIFLILLAAGIAVALKLRGVRKPQTRLNMPDSGLVGRQGTLVDASPVAPRVRIGDSDWAARLPRDAGVLPVGSRVRVDGVDGNTLIVRAD